MKLDNFHKVLHRPESNRLFTRFKMQVLIWLTETETGDLDEIGQLYRYQHFLPELVHDGKLSKKVYLFLRTSGNAVKIGLNRVAFC